MTWQMSDLPCSHVCVVIRTLRHNMYQYIDPCFHVSMQHLIYSSVSTITNTQYAKNLWRWEFARLCGQLLSCSTTPSCETFSRKTSTKMHWVTVCNGIGHNRSKCNNPLSWHVPFLCLYDSNILYHPIHSSIGYMVRGCWFSFLCIGLVIGTMPYFVIFMI